jgi:hypothetical protein
MHSRILRDRLAIVSQSPRRRLGSESAGNRAAFLFTYWTNEIARVSLPRSAGLFFMHSNAQVCTALSVETGPIFEYFQ